MNPMIKKPFPRFLSIAAFVLAAVYCCAQQADELQGFQGFAAPKPMKNEGALKFSPFPIFDGQIDFTGELRVTYERKIAKRQTITIGASYDYPNFILLAIGRSLGGGGGRRGGGGYGRGGAFNSFSIEGGRITFGYRYYPLKKQQGLKGLFVGPYLSYNAVNIRDKSASADYEVVNYFDASAITGYQLVLKNHFSFEIFGGLGYKNNFVEHYNQEANSIYNDYVPKIQALDNVKIVMQMNFGYAF
jgi:hypothetical protein